MSSVLLGQVPRDNLIGAWEFNAGQGTEAAADLGVGTITFAGAAAYSAPGTGQTGNSGDTALSFGTEGNALAFLRDVPFMELLNAANANDNLTVVWWQRYLIPVTPSTDNAQLNSSTLWFSAATSELGAGPGADRASQVHAPWNNASQVYWDSAGTGARSQGNIFTGGNQAVTTFPSFDWQQWNHFVLRKEGGSKQVWINGVLFLDHAGVVPLLSNVAELRIGGGDNATRFFRGMIDDLGIFNVALTPEQIGLLATRAEPLALAPELRPPNIGNLSPANGTLFHPVSGGVSFTVSTVSPNAVPTGSIEVFLNEVAVPAGQLTIGGSATERTVSYTGTLQVNQFYTVRVVARDDSNRESTRSWSFDTINQEAVTMIEAEDFNFSGGSYINNPVPALDFVATNSYWGKGYDTGVQGTDFNDLNPTVRQPTGTEWRHFDFVPLPQTAPNTDFLRQKYQAEGAAADFDLLSIVAGEWFNYTRDFSGNYRVYLRGRATAGQTVMLDQVTSDRAQPDQTTVNLGSFSLASGGYAYAALKDFSGDDMVISLNGTQTLRLAGETANNNLNLNYILLVPTTDPATVIGPIVESTTPAAGATDARRDRIAATIVNRQTSLNASSVELRINGTLATGVTVTPTETGAEVSHTISPALSVGAEQTAELRYRDTLNNEFSYEWTFTTTSDVSGPELIFTAASLQGGLKVRVYFSEPVDPVTAGMAGNYSSSGGIAFSGQPVVLGDRGVELTGTGGAEGQVYTLTVSNVQDAFGNVMIPASTIAFNPSRFLQDAAGILVVEAESYASIFGPETANPETIWMHGFDKANYSGGGAMMNPDLGVPNASNDPMGEGITRMDYQVHFVRAGTHQIWIRAAAGPGGGGSDSLHAGFNGVQFGGIAGFNNANYVWSTALQADTGANTFTVDAPGDHTINIWRREDGAYLDKFVIAHVDSGFTSPGGTNLGPDQSFRAGDGFAAGISSVSPDDGAAGVLKGTLVSALLSHGSPHTVNSSTIKLFFDDQDVTAQATVTPIGTSGLDVSYAPALSSQATHTARIEFSDTASPPNTHSMEWSFTVAYFPDHTYSGGIILVTDRADQEGVGGGMLGDYLRSVGYNVHVEPTPGNASTLRGDLTPEEITLLESFDLVIAHRSLDSAQFGDSAVRRQQWNNLNVPLILGSAFVTRNNPARWNWVQAGQVRTTAIGVDVVMPEHPIVAGWGSDLFVRAIDIDHVGTTNAGNGTVIATAGAAGNLAIAVWEGSGTFWEGGDQTYLRRRINFPLMRYYETGATAGQFFEYSPNGLQLILNAVEYGMTGQVTVAPPSPGLVILDATMEGTTFTVTVQSQTGRNYALQHKNTVTDASWTTLPAVPGTGEVLELTDTTATASARIYRVVETPAP